MIDELDESGILERAQHRASDFLAVRTIQEEAKIDHRYES